jgi:DNA-directed RNA polymerase omega subunit
MDDATEFPADDLEVGEEGAQLPAEPVPPIRSRFLFVDVAALRAKQLRRGARQRFDSDPGTPSPHKPERVAMEEVRRGLVYYDIPRPVVPPRAEGEA